MHDHACRVADLALEMLDIMNSLRTLLQIDLQARVGIHTGPAVAGVIGTHKFIYDVWGDTVNTASRMETFGAPGQIHVSTQTRHILGSAYAFEARGPLRHQGQGLDGYLLPAGISDMPRWPAVDKHLLPDCVAEVRTQCLGILNRLFFEVVGL